MSVTAKTAVYGVIGDPIGHSLSPVVLNAAFARKSIDAIYLALGVRRDQWVDALTGCRILGVAGLNVTFPHKEAAASAADQRSSRVELLGAANTLRFERPTPSGGGKPASVISAHNTDAPGTVLALEIFGGQRCRAKRVAVFGAGGAARAAALGLLEAGVQSVAFLARNPNKARLSTERLRSSFPDRGFSYAALCEDHLGTCAGEVGQADFVIQATPVGMGGITEDDPIGRLLQIPDLLRSGQTCLDVVYHPRETRFLRQASKVGATALDGLTLLVSQAAESFTRWTGETCDPKQMYAHLEAHLARQDRR